MPMEYRISVLVLLACKNQFQNWVLQTKNPVCPTWFLQLDFYNLIFQKSSTDQQEAWVLQIIPKSLIFFPQWISAVQNMFFMSFALCWLSGLNILLRSIPLITEPGNLWPSPPGTFHILIGKFSYFVIKNFNQIFFVINFSYFAIKFLLNSSMVKSDNQIGKVNDKKNMILKSDNEIGKFWNRKKGTYRRTGPIHKSRRSG